MTTGNSKRCCHGNISSKSNEGRYTSATANVEAMAAVLRDTSGSSDEGGKTTAMLP